MNFELAKNLVESLIFSAEQPLSKSEIKKILLEHGEFDIDKILEELSNEYIKRGICLFSSDNKYYFKTSDDLNDYLTIQTKKTKKSLERSYGNACNNILPSTSYKSRNRKDPWQTSI